MWRVAQLLWCRQTLSNSSIEARKRRACSLGGSLCKVFNRPSERTLTALLGGAQLLGNCQLVLPAAQGTVQALAALHLRGQQAVDAQRSRSCLRSGAAAQRRC